LNPVELQDAGEQGLRRATRADLKWIMVWASRIGVPAPSGPKYRHYIATRKGDRIGYVAVAHEQRDGEPFYWLASLFVLPEHHRTGGAFFIIALLALHFYPSGKVGARVAKINERTLHLLDESPAFERTGATRGYVEFTGEFAIARRIAASLI
jgi:hypothetical protein